MASLPPRKRWKTFLAPLPLSRPFTVGSQVSVKMTQESLLHSHFDGTVSFFVLFVTLTVQLDH